MNFLHQSRPPSPPKPRRFVTKQSAILSWDIRHDDATPEQRAEAMKQIEQRFKEKS